MEKHTKIRRLLFLTSTVSPKNGLYVGSIERRREEYIRSVRFYLDNTDYPVLIVDNSRYDFRKDFPNEKRLETLCYDQPANNRGKGYEELLIMDYGMRHSIFINQCNQIIKVSGRYIFRNILTITSHFKDANAVYAEWNIQFKQVETWLMAGPKEFYTDLIENKDDINEDKNFPIERLAAVIMDKWTREGRCTHSFLLPTNISGHPGCAESQYKSPTLIKYIKVAMKYAVCEIRNCIMSIRR